MLSGNFQKKIIKLFNGNLFNYHAADLPSERGGANISWRILLNKKKIYLLIFIKLKKISIQVKLSKLLKFLLQIKKNYQLIILKKLDKKKINFYNNLL